MAIASSSYAIDAHTQIDGARYVRESHTDSTGRVHSYHYLLPSGQGGAEATAFINARVDGLNTALADAEAEAILGA